MQLSDDFTKLAKQLDKVRKETTARNREHFRFLDEQQAKIDELIEAMSGMLPDDLTDEERIGILDFAGWDAAIDAVEMLTPSD